MNLTTLGNAPRVAYLPGLPLAPPPKRPTMRRNITAVTTRPTELADPGQRQRAGSIISGLAIGVVLLDHNARQLRELGRMPAGTRKKIEQLAELTDTTLATMASTFDMQDGDAINTLSDVMSQAVELLLQLRPQQIERVLQYAHGLAHSNLDYTPAP